MDTYESIREWERTGGRELFDGLLPGSGLKLLDYGCGWGHYTMALSRAFAERGTVWAVDVNRELLAALDERIASEKMGNIVTEMGRADFSQRFEADFFDLILYSDVFHGRGLHRGTMLCEAGRTLKRGGLLSVVAFHLSSFSDREGNRRRYTLKRLSDEIEDYGFTRCLVEGRRGIHFEKVYSPYYIRRGGVRFEDLERGEVLFFRRN